MASTRALFVGLAVIAAIALGVAGVVTAQQVIGSPDVSVYSPADRLTPGQDTTLPIYVSNEGDVVRAGPGEAIERVTTARGLTVEVLDDSTPFTVNTGRFPVGTVPQGTQGPFDVSVSVPADVQPGEYRVPVRVQYSYTSMVDSGESPPEFREATRTTVTHVTVEIPEEPRFVFVDRNETARGGGQGNVSLTIRNVGSEAARNASVQVSSPSDEVVIGGESGASQAFASQWDPKTNQTFSFATRVSPDAIQREYPIVARITYDDESGIRRNASGLITGFAPAGTQGFAIENLTSSLTVGEPGTVRGTIRNTGSSTVRNAVVYFGANTPNLRSEDPAVAVGRIDPGEAASFEHAVFVTDQARAGSRQLNFSVGYRDEGDTRQRSDPLEPRVTIDPERDWLSVTGNETTVGIDSDNRLTVELQNVQNEPLQDVQARLEASPPFSSEASSAFVATLPPGETADVAFGLTVSDEAVPTRASVSVNVTGERPDGERINAGTYTVPVTITESAGPGNTTLLVGGAIVVVLSLAVGWWWLNRR